jgi:hypothetical protein
MTGFIDPADLESFSIVQFLSNLGYYPVRKSGKEHIYHSMLRNTQKKTPSFCVYDAGGKWKDWGGANESGIQGGGIIQLGKAYWPALSYHEVLQRIREVYHLQQVTPPVQQPVIPAADNTPKFELLQIKDLGTNFVLSQYLESRGIRDVASPYLRELYYRHRNNNSWNGIFYAVGWPNERQGWEFANAKGFKSSIGPKAISYLPDSKAHLVLFEGFMDYLSWLKLHPRTAASAIILNSVSMLTSAFNLIANFSRIDCYFDRDAAGKQCTEDLQSQFPEAVDHSTDYLNHKDYNAYLMDQIQQEQIHRLHRNQHGTPDHARSR